MLSVTQEKIRVAARQTVVIPLHQKKSATITSITIVTVSLTGMIPIANVCQSEKLAH
jgi:hypothetical protein